jgi:nucleoside-diphosphate-sugar epimerase
VASVFGPTENHQETALQNVQGTCDVLETVHCWRDDDSSDNNNKACKVILTSSMAAVRGSGQAPSNGKFYTAADWNTNSVLGANWGASYQWSKMESEQRARQLAENYNIPLVSMCPSFVFGPPYGGGESSSFSIQLVRQWTQGESPVQSRLLVDLRDVAAAHVRAGQSASLQTGRLILSTDARVPSRRLADWIRDATAPQYRDAIHSDDEFTGGAIPIGQKEVEAEGPLRDILGIELRTIQETMQDMTVRLVEQQQ